MKKRSKLKKGLAILLTAAMVVGLVPNAGVMKASAAETYDENGFAADGSYQPATDSDNDGVYEISNAGQLYWFAALVNGDTSVAGVTASNTGAGAILMNDIVVNQKVLTSEGDLVSDTGSLISWTPIGNDSKKYAGTFDGQNHTVSGLYFSDKNTDYIGLFGCVNGDGKVSDVGVADSYFYGRRYIGNVCGWNYGTITNCHSTGTLKGYEWFGGICGSNSGKIQKCYYAGSKVNADYTVGGICGYNNADGEITNCYNEGTITANYSGAGGISSNNYGTITNCYSIGTITAPKNVGGICGRNLSGSVATNCYYLEGTATGGIEGADTEGSAEKKTESQFHGGGVCYLLNGSNSGADLPWGQDLSDDTSYPVLGGRTVGCDAEGNYFNPSCEQHSWVTLSTVAHTCTEDGYDIQRCSVCGLIQNNNIVTAPGHNWVNRVCSACGTINPEPILVDGVYQIGTKEELYWFADYVNKGNRTANAALTADIEVNRGVLDESGNLVSNTSTFVVWTPIGNSMSNSYKGTFDGKNHAISGLYFNDENGGDIGLFGRNISGVIKNVMMKDFYFKGKENVGGICGYNNTRITNCYSTGTVEGNESVGGICGYNLGSITNCYSAGIVKGFNSGNKIGGVCGWNDSTGTINNCYFDSKRCDTNDAVGYNTNDSEGAVSDVAGKTTDEFRSGEVAYLLNGRNSENTEDKPLIWYQNIDSGTADTYPVLDNTHGTVYIGNPCQVYTNESHKEHRYIISEDGKSHTCSDCGKTEQHADVATFTVDNENHSITATCPAGCELGTVTLSETGEIYDGAEKSHVSGEIKGFSPVIVYEKKAEDGSFATIDSIPKDAGTYRASITYTVGEEPENKYSVSVEYTIAKADTTQTENCEMVLTFDEYSNTYTATITEVDGAEYKFDNGEWSDKNMYTGIAHGTEVTGYIRIAPISANYNPGAESSKTLTAGHGTMTHVEAKAADCVTDGNSEYWYCERCKKYFSDAQGTTKTTKEAVTIAATGHTDSNNDGSCEVCNAYMDGIGAKLAGYSLSLNGNIGVNFYMELSEAIAGNENAYMEFALPNTAEKTKVYVTGTHEDGATATTSTVDDKTYYVFSCEVAAKEMTDEIQAQMIVGENEGTVYTYTVKDYADYILSHTESYDEKVVALVKAMLNYGAYSQTYFDYQTAKLANADLAEADKALVTLTADDLSSYKASVNKDEAVCTFASAYLTLQSETAVHVYVKLADELSEEDVTFKIDDSEIAKENLVKGTGTYEGYYILSVDHIQASALDDRHTFTVTATGGQTASLSYGPMSYCYSILAGESASDDLKNVVKALYAFNQAADSYGAN